MGIDSDSEAIKRLVDFRNASMKTAPVGDSYSEIWTTASPMPFHRAMAVVGVQHIAADPEDRRASHRFRTRTNNKNNGST